MGKYLVFTEKRIAFMVTCTVLNRYDFYVIIDGLRGCGKSTTAYRLSKDVSSLFRRLYNGDIDLILEIYYTLKSKRKDLTLAGLIKQIIKLKKANAYIFKPVRDLIYSQRAAKEFLQGWNQIGIFDEFINIGFSRDFFDKGQKDLIKLINLNRDHGHVIFACVPHFATIDNQLRNLSKMRLYIKERGLGVLLQPNKSLTLKDKWDMDASQKVERKWMDSNIKNPRWEKLSTFRGLVKTRPLTELDETSYQKIKTDKRNEIVSGEMNVQSPQEKSKSDYNSVVDKLINNEVKSYDELDGLAFSLSIKPTTLKKKLRETLSDRGEITQLSEHFYDKQKALVKLKEKKAEKTFGINSDNFDKDINDVFNI